MAVRGIANSTPVVGDPVERRAEPGPRRGGSLTRFVGGTLLNVAAFGGIVCLVLVVLAVGFNLTLIMFRTGSMGPGIPAGSVALVQEIAASEIRVGDVVTVDRAGALPITHRVTSIATTGSADTTTSAGTPISAPDDARVITLRGDANPADDPAPYTVTQVRIVLGSVPGLAVVVMWFSNPWVLAALTLGAAVLVTWAFWPRAGAPRTEASEVGHKASGPDSASDIFTAPSCAGASDSHGANPDATASDAPVSAPPPGAGGSP